MLMVMILRIYTSDGDNVVLADGGGGDGDAMYIAKGMMRISCE